MIAGKREPLAAAEVLDPVYRQLGEWAKLTNVQEVRVAYERDAARKVELLARLGGVVRGSARQRTGGLRGLRSQPRVRPGQREHAGCARASCGAARQLDRGDPALRHECGATQGWRRRTPACSSRFVLPRSTRSRSRNVDAAIARYRIVVELTRPTRKRSKRSTASTNPRAVGASWPRSCARNRNRADARRHARPQFRLGQVLQSTLDPSRRRGRQYRDILAAAPEYEPACARSRRCLPTARCRWRSAKCSSLCTACRAPGTP